MNDTIINLFKYFAAFVPKEVLKAIFVQPADTQKAGYAEIESEILATDDARVIPQIEKYIVSVNESFVSEKIKNTEGFILFVEYGKMSVDHNIERGVSEALAITVAHNFSDNNNDNINEILLSNQCLEILDKIVRAMEEEQEGIDFCASEELVSYPVEYQPIEPFVFYGCGGWCAMFNNQKTIL